MISLAHLSDVEVYLVSFFVPCFANVEGLTVAVIKRQRTILQMMLMMMRSISDDEDDGDDWDEDDD